MRCIVSGADGDSVHKSSFYKNLEFDQLNTA